MKTRSLFQQMVCVWFWLHNTGRTPTNWLERVWLEPLSYKERLQDQGSFGQGKEWFGEHSTASWALMEGMEKTELGSSQQCMVRG